MVGRSPPITPFDLFEVDASFLVFNEPEFCTSVPLLVFDEVFWEGDPVLLVVLDDLHVLLLVSALLPGWVQNLNSTI